MKPHRKLLTAAALALAMAVPATALAAESSIDAYGDDSTILQTTEQGDPGRDAAGTPAGEKAGASSNLPFTGLDLGLLGVGGGALLALGLGMRRLSRSVDLA